VSGGTPSGSASFSTRKAVSSSPVHPVSDSLMLYMPRASAARFIFMAAIPALKIAKLMLTADVSAKSLNSSLSPFRVGCS